MAGISLCRRFQRSKWTYSTLSARFSTKLSTWSNFVVKRFKDVTIPPLGPRLYLTSA